MAHVGSQTLAALAALQSVPDRDVRHVDGCLRCRRAAIDYGVSDAELAASLAATRSRGSRVIAAAVIASVVGVAAVAAPLRGAAFSFFAFFEPRAVVAVPMTFDEIRSLSRIPDLSAYATTRDIGRPSSAMFSDARAATSAAGFALRHPTFTPTGMRVVSFLVNGRSDQLLTFGKPSPKPGETLPAVPPLPADIAGSTLAIGLGPTVLTSYETGATVADRQRLTRALQRIAPAQPTHAWRSGSASGYAGHVAVVQSNERAAGFGFGRGGMPLIVVQMPVPRIGTTGVSLARLSSFMLDQPGIPPRVAAAFRAFGDISTTLPIPVPIDKAYTQPVTVDGVQGVGIGDDTGIGAAVIWQKNGMLYAVSATRTAREVLAIANSLR